MAVKIGALRQRVTLQGLTHIRNSFGEEVPTYVDLDTVWAEVKPLRGNEYFKAQQVASELDHKVTIRYRKNVTTRNRLKYGTRYFGVQAVIDPDERHRHLVLMCKEKISADD